MPCLWGQRNNWGLWTLGWKDMFGLRQDVVPATIFGRKLKTSREGRGPRSEGKTQVEVLCLGSKAVLGGNDVEMCAPWPEMGWDLQCDMLWEGLREKERLRGTRVTPLAPRLKPKHRAFLWGSGCTAKDCSDTKLRQDLWTRDIFWVSAFLSHSLLEDVDVSCLLFSPTARFSLPEWRKAETAEDLWPGGLWCALSTSSDDGSSEGNWMVRGGLGITVCLRSRGLDRLMGAPSTSRFTPTYWGTSTAAWEGDKVKHK